MEIYLWQIRSHICTVLHVRTFFCSFQNARSVAPWGLRNKQEYAWWSFQEECSREGTVLYIYFTIQSRNFLVSMCEKVNTGTVSIQEGRNWISLAHYTVQSRIDYHSRDVSYCNWGNSTVFVLHRQLCRNIYRNWEWTLLQPTQQLCIVCIFGFLQPFVNDRR